MRNQRKTTREQTDKLIVEGNTCETGEEKCKAWASHFQKLALPLENENFDNEYKLLVDMDIESITAICEAESKNIDPLTEQEATKALRKLKNNKAADSIGLCGEHLKLGGTPVVGLITSSLNCLIRARAVTAVLKKGIITPIYKKGDPTNPGNYRGITVTPVLLKVLEHVLNRRHNKILEETQSKLQKGFTEGCSSLSAAVILTECILE